MKKFYTITVDGNLIKVIYSQGLEQLNLLQYLHQLGKDIPHFCYHERLGIAGNCRMCLIQTNLAKKLQVACSLIMSDGLIVNMLSARVKRAQEAVLGFLLSNHPLDCPICDQGGECDLQDLTLLYGADRNNFYETEKRSVLDKNFGVLVKTSMNRCIHCMRCVRFYKNIVGMPLLGAIGRGFKSEIDTYAFNFLDDELSGNIIDLCPVGALTAKVYAFQYRSWELQNLKTVDFQDVLYTSISFNIFGNKLVRVLPEVNYLVNDSWITNKTRFSYELLNLKRISKGIWFIQKMNVFVKNEYLLLSTTSIAYLFGFLFFNINWARVFPVLSVVTEFLDLYAFKTFFNNIGINIFFTLDNAANNFDLRSFYMLYWGLEDLKYFSSCILIGFNPRMENPLLNIRFRQLWLNNKVLFLNFGPILHTPSFNVVNISKDLFTFFYLLEGRSSILRSFFFSSSNFLPFFFLGISVLKHVNNTSLTLVFLSFLKVLYRILNLSNFWRFIYKGFNFFSLFSFLPMYSISLNKNEAGLYTQNFFKCLSNNLFYFNETFKNTSFSAKTLFYFFGLGNWAKYNNFIFKQSDSFCVYQGVVFENLDYSSFDLFIPNLGFYEKNSLVLNFVKDVQETICIFKYDNNVLTAENFFKITLDSVIKNYKRHFYYFFFSHCFFKNKFGLSILNLYKELQKINFSFSSFSLNFKKFDWLSYFLYTQRKFFLTTGKLLFNKIKMVIFNLYLDVYLIQNISLMSNSMSNNYLLNYFDETDSFFVKNSKTMNLCMLSYSKRNFSFFF